MTVALAEVARLLQDVAAEVVTPRFRALAADQVSEKAKGDLVTVADREAEALITAGLRDLDPTAAVVGEEAVAADPSVLRRLHTADRVWVVDPVDGTANFVAGSPDHAVMAALVEGGTTVASVIWQPQHDLLFTAEKGAGAFCNGEPVSSVPASRVLPAATDLQGTVAAAYLPDGVRRVVERNVTRFRAMVASHRCAGVSYGRLAQGVDGFALFFKSLPWDHAPGALLLEEAGGAVRRWDGTPYRPGQSGTGLLAIGMAERWGAVRAALLD